MLYDTDSHESLYHTTLAPQPQHNIGWVAVLSLPIPLYSYFNKRRRMMESMFSPISFLGEKQSLARASV